MAHSAVRDFIADYLSRYPDATNDEVAEQVRLAIPGANTTGASVSSVKSRLKSEGHDLSSSSSRGMPTAMLPEPDPEETYEQAEARISVRYRALERLSKRAVAGNIASLIISGPPGLGKSFTVRKDLEASGRVDYMGIEDLSNFADDPEDWCRSNNVPGVHDSIQGSISTVGLYQSLYYMRKGGFLFLDDVDAVFRDEDSLNLLKAALDSDPRHRRISWRKEARWLEEYGMPKTFLFEGNIVFLTNIDFEEVIRKGHRDAEHFKALIDRSSYLCLTLRTRRDFLIRIRQVADGEDGMLAKVYGLDAEVRKRVLDFVEDHADEFYNLSLRLVDQIALTIKSYKAESEEAAKAAKAMGEEVKDFDPDGWMEDILATKTRTY